MPDTTPEQAVPSGVTRVSTAVLCENPALRDCWYAVARVDAVAVGPVTVTLLGTPVVLYRSAHGVVAAPDRCPHREAPLSAGDVRDGCLVCPYHGWTFGEGGECIHVPSSAPGGRVPPRAHLETFAVAERYGLVWVCLGTPRDELPVVPEDDDPTFRRLSTPVEVWRTCVARMTDNFCDISHFPWVHRGTFGAEQETAVAHLELGDLDNGWFGYAYEVTVGNTAASSVVSGEDSAVVDRAMTTGFRLPFAVRSTIEYRSGLRHVLLLLATPIDDVTSLFTFVVWRNDDHDVPADEVLRFDLAIGAEDKAMLERIPGVMPLGQSALVSVRADTCSVEWRRRLVSFMAGETGTASTMPA